jgi:hypothetical protein
MGGQGELSEAIARVEADLQALEELQDVRLRTADNHLVRSLFEKGEFPHEVSDLYFVCIVMDGDDRLAAISVPRMVSSDCMTERLANSVQDALVGRRLFRAWPRCPEHEHQLLAETEELRAIWRCPTSEAVVCTIGEYSVVAGWTGES